MSTLPFDGINAGDKVRVEYPDGCAEGVYGVTAFGTPFLAFGDPNNDELALRAPFTSVTVLRRALPPEPPRWSVVLDEVDVAWQRGEFSWWRSIDGVVISVQWATLNAGRTNPLRVLWAPEADK